MEDQKAELNKTLENPNGKDREAVDETISIWLVLVVIAAIVAVFALAGLIIRTAFLEPAAPRTAIERNILKYKAIVEKNPGDFKARLNLANAYIESGDYSAAERELGEAIRTNPRNAEAHFSIAELSEARGDIKRAISEYYKVVSLDKKNERAYYRLGLIFIHQSDYRKASEAFKKVIEINPMLADAHYYLGISYERIGDRSSARKQYQEALKYVPDYQEAKNALSRVSR